MVHKNNRSKKFKGILLDVYGVLEYKGKPCLGAITLIEGLLEKNIPFRLLKKRNLQSRQSMSEKLQLLGFPVKKEHVITASSATALYLKSVKAENCRVVVDGRGLEEFNDIPKREDYPEYLVLGDARDGFTFANINQMYRQLLSGSKLVVQIPNITSKEKDGPEITVGGYGKMLELATKTPAVWIGKPSRLMFDLALSDMNLSKDEVLMVGDNVQIDVDGAKNAEISSGLVHSGEFENKSLGPNDNPDYVFDRIDEILEYV